MRKKDATKQSEKKQSVFASRKWRYGGFATAFTVIFVVIVVLINFMVSALGNAVDLNLYVRSDDSFKLSEDSIQYLEGITTPVTITILGEREALYNKGKYYAQAIGVVEDYAKHSDKITVRYVDLYKNPNFKDNYPNLTLEDEYVIVESERRSTAMSIISLFSLSQDYTSIMSYAEQMLTSAIVEVSSEDLPKVALLTGIGEDNEDAQSLLSLLGANAYDTTEVAIPTEEIPEDVDVLLLCAPTYDLTEEALEKLDAFLYNNGEFGKHLSYFASSTQPSLPNLEAFLAEWGIDIGEGVVYETDLNRMISQSLVVIYPDYTDTPFEYAQSLSQNGIPTVLPYSRPLGVLFEQNGTTKTNVLMQFPSSSAVMPPDAGEDFDAQNPEQRGPFPALIVSTRGQTTDSEVTSSVVVSSSAMSLVSNYLQSGSLGNIYYYLGLFNYVCENENKVNITPVTIINYLPVTQTQTTICLIVFVVLLPLAVLIWGIVVWLRRRHL